MEHYVTLFDSLFLPQGLALHMSMERHVKNYTLWIVCVDVCLYELLKKMKLSNVQLIKLSDEESDTLKALKNERNKAEYCWTLTPFAPKFVFNKDKSVDRVTYLDADVWFRKSPSPIFDELEKSNKKVLITDHSYSPQFDQSRQTGQYCVQFITFYRCAENIRSEWERQCVNWCYERIEEGKFGDQKYLDVWPNKYSSLVHVLNNKELMLAPWNATRFPYGNSVMWHFHSLRIIKVSQWGERIYIGEYPIPPVCIENIYVEYLKDIKKAIVMLMDAGFAIGVQKKISKLSLVLIFIKNTLMNGVRYARIPVLKI